LKGRTEGIYVKDRVFVCKKGRRRTDDGVRGKAFGTMDIPNWERKGRR